MAKSDDLVKYITQRVVTYMDTPKEVRKLKRKEWKERPKESLDYRLFGMASLSVRIWLDKAKRRRQIQEEAYAETSSETGSESVSEDLK